MAMFKPGDKVWTAGDCGATSVGTPIPVTVVQKNGHEFCADYICRTSQGLISRDECDLWRTKAEAACAIRKRLRESIKATEIPEGWQ